MSKTSQKILVVEDEPSIADNIIYALTTEGFSPTHCHTGEDALQALDSGDYILMVLDIGLPDINGFELAKKVRQSSSMPIVFVTARNEEVDKIVGLELGADDYVTKPFSPRELCARVKAILRRTANGDEVGSSRDESIKYGSFSLDKDRHRICYKESVLDLSRYEFRILSILIRSPGRVYTREHLMQLAWESPEMSTERTVDTHIKTIRQKLRQIETEREIILTHRGIGYSLLEEG